MCLLTMPGIVLTVFQFDHRKSVALLSSFNRRREWSTERLRNWSKACSFRRQSQGVSPGIPARGWAAPLILALSRWRCTPAPDCLRADLGRGYGEGTWVSLTDQLSPILSPTSWTSCHSRCLDSHEFSPLWGQGPGHVRSGWLSLLSDTLLWTLPCSQVNNPCTGARHTSHPTGRLLCTPHPTLDPAPFIPSAEG